MYAEVLSLIHLSSPSVSKTIIRQGDTSQLSFKLVSNKEGRIFDGLSGKALLSKNGYKFYETSVSISANNIVTFQISDVLPHGEYKIEILIGSKFKFPSGEETDTVQITKSAEYNDVNLIERYGKDQLIAEVVPKVEKASAEEVANIVKPRVIPSIDSDGTWVIDGQDTGKPSRGAKGDKGEPFQFEDLTQEQILELRGEPVNLTPFLKKTEADAKFLTQEQARFNYQPKGNYLTEAQSDSRYHPLTEGVVTLTDKQFEQEIVTENLVKNGNFSNGTTSWSSASQQITHSENGLIAEVLEEGTAINYISTTINEVKQNDKLYIYFNVENLSDKSANLIGYFANANNNRDYLPNFQMNPNEKMTKTFLLQFENPYGSSADLYFLRTYPKIVGFKYLLREIAILNLTSVFGTGNEPTKEEMDSYMDNAVIDWANNEIKFNANVSILGKLAVLENKLKLLGGKTNV